MQKDYLDAFFLNADGERSVSFLNILKKVLLDLKPQDSPIPSIVYLL